MRPTSWVLLLLAGGILWLAARGRLANAVYAAEHDLGGSGSSGSSGSGGGSGTSTGHFDSGHPAPSLFGVVNAQFSGLGEGLGTYVAQADQAGLQAFGGGVFAHDYDYATPLNTRVNLPGPSADTFTYLGDQTDPRWGHILGFRNDRTHGVLEFGHVAPAGLTVGQHYGGGTIVGSTAAPPAGVNSYWTGPHFAVIVDTIANTFLQGL